MEENGNGKIRKSYDHLDNVKDGNNSNTVKPKQQAGLEEQIISKGKRSRSLPDLNTQENEKTETDDIFKIGSTVAKKKGAQRCPIFVARSEYNLLQNKGLQLIELLGEGSYAKVYLCRKTTPLQGTPAGVSVVLALKVIDASKTSVDYAKKFLPRELSILLKLKHPNIIKIYLVFQRKSKYYLCMRYAERGDLLEYVLTNALITENRVRFWTNQLGTAIEYLHTMNIVHRDIKTENVLITLHFNVKLCDFGFSRFIRHDEISSTFCGSISYSSPEVLQTRPYDARKADMWSLGVVIYVMLVRRLPFQETDNPKALLSEQLQKSYVMPPKIQEILSQQAKKVLKHLLEPNPKKRWSIQELLQSNWMAMDLRLKKRSAEQVQLLEDATKIAEGYPTQLNQEIEEIRNKIESLTMKKGVEIDEEETKD